MYLIVGFFFNISLHVGTKQACVLTKSLRFDGLPENVQQLVDKFEVPNEVNKNWCVPVQCIMNILYSQIQCNGD